MKHPTGLENNRSGLQTRLDCPAATCLEVGVALSLFLSFYFFLLNWTYSVLCLNVILLGEGRQNGATFAPTATATDVRELGLAN